MYFIRLSVFVLSLIPIICFSQGEANVWYFGDGAGLDFNTNPPTQLEDGNAGLLSATGEGVGAISDGSGNILFYTNGSTIYDASHNAMPNGTGLNGSGTTTQTGLIVPVPGSTTQYYVISTSAGNAAKYVIVDMTLNGGLGDVTIPSLNGGNGTQLVASPAAEGSLVIPEYDASNVPTGDFWVIFHGTSDANYHVFKADAGGITPHPTNPIQTQGFVVPGQPVMIFKTNSCFDKIGVAFYNEPRVEVLPFDVVTGIISAPELVLDGLTSGSGPFLNDEVYGIEFSPSGQFLYITEAGLNNRRTVYQFDRSLGTGTNPAAVLASKVYYTDGTTNRFGQLQLGPDGKIYFPGFDFSDPTWINTIPNPDVKWTLTTPTVADPSEIEMEKYTFNAKKVGEGLPPFLKNLLTEIRIFYNNACEGGTTDFTYVFGGAAVSWSWDFGDPASGGLNTSTSPNPSHVYATAGTYTVTLTIIDNCGRTRTGTVDVIVKSGPTFSIPGTTCPNTDIDITGTGTNAANYSWSSSATGSPVIGTGSVYTYNGPLPATIYVEDPTPLATYTTGHIDATQTFSSDDGYTYFETFTTISIQSFDITERASGETTDFSIQSDDGLTTYWGPTTHNTTASNNIVTIPVGITLGPGLYRFHTTDKDAARRNNTDDDGDRDVTGVIDIQGEKNGSKGGSFYNIVVDLPDPCGIRAVDIPLNCCTPPTITTQPSDETRCEGVAVSFTVATSAGSPSYQWQLSTDNGSTWNDISGENSDIYSIAAGSVSSSINNYQYRAIITSGGCSATSDAGTLTVSPPPAAPTVSTPVTYCEGETATALTATGSNLLWYTVSTGGTGSATAPTPSTASAGSTDHYVSQTVSGCEGPRATITVDVTALPAAPTVSTPVAYCEGETATALTATGSNLLWYTVSTGGTGSATAPTPSTASAGSTDHYVSQTVSGCEGPRASITVDVNSLPSAPTVSTPVTYCKGETATALTATGSNLLWYTVSTGGTGSATAPTPSTASAGSTDHYVSQTVSGCEGPRATITVDVNASPAAPTVSTPVTYCEGETALALTATGSNLLWYTVSTGGTGSATAPTPSTASAGSTDHYVSQTVSGCEGPRATITVDVTALPATPTASTPVTYCEGETSTALSATGSNLLWYTVSTGGTGSATAPTPSTASAGSTDHYVSQTVSGCEGPRATITVDVNALPSAPTVSTPVTYCEGETTTALTATGSNLLWYTVAVGGTGSATAPTPSTASAGSTDYYVSQTVSGCEGPRATIAVDVNASPAAPTVSTPVTYCLNDAAVALTATGTNLQWYTVAVGGTGSGVAPTPSTAAAGTVSYYVSQTVTGCEGPRAQIDVVTNDLPVPVIDPTSDMCEGSTVTFTNTAHTSGTYAWTVTGTGVSDNGSTTQNIDVTAGSGNITISVIWTDGNGCANNPAVTQNINVDAAPPVATTGGDVNVCVVDPIALTGNNPSPGTGTWTIEPGSTAGITIDNPTQFNSNVTGFSSGGDVLIATWEISNGICPTSSAQMTITGTGVADPIVNLSDDAGGTVCEGTTVNFTATPTNGGSSPMYTFLDANDNVLQTQSSTATLPLTVTQDTTVYVVLLSNSSCATDTDDTSAVININVDPLPDPAVAGADFDVCTSTSNLTANTPTNGTGAWSSSSSAVVTTPSDPNSGVTALPIGTTTFTWTISSGSCPSTSDDLVINRAGTLTTANVSGQNTTICESDTYPTLTGTPLNGAASPAESGSWTSLDGATITPSGIDATIDAASMNGENTYRFVYEITNGLCIPNSTDTVTIIVDGLPTTSVAGSDDAICTGGYQLSGNDPTIGTGMWTADDPGVTFDDPTLFDAQASNIQAGITNFVWTISNGTCSVSTDNVDITRSGSLTTPLAGSDQTICETGTATMAANAPSGTETGTWSTSGDGGFDDVNSEIAIYTPGPNDITNGSASLTWTIGNGVCPDATNDMTLTLDQVPATPNAGADAQTCSDTITLAATSPAIGTGVWTSNDIGINYDDATSNNAEATNLQTGTTTFTWTVTNGVCPSVSDDVDIERINTLTPVSPGVSQTICEGSTLTMNANTPNVGETITWSGPGTITSSNDPSTTVTGLSNGTHTFTLTTSNGLCPDVSSTVDMQVDENPVVPNAGLDENICTSDYLLSGSTPSIGSGVWSSSDAGVTFDNNTITNATASNLQAGTTTFTWTITNGVCPSVSDNVDITKSGTLTSPNAGTDQVLCEINPVNLSANTPGAGETGTWSGPGVFSDPNDESSSVSTLTPGTYTFTWTISNGVCPDADDEVIITIDAEPDASMAGVDTTVCGDAYTLTANTPIVGNGTWSISGIGSITDLTNPTSDVTSLSGTTTLTWTISNGSCSNSSDDVVITAQPTVTPSIDISVDLNPVCQGTNQTFTATNSVGGGSNPTFEWLINSTSQGPAQTTNTFNSSSLTDGSAVEVIMYSDLQCATPNSAQASTTVTISTPPSPQIDAPTTNLCEDESTSISAINTNGGNLIWYLDGIQNGTGSSITINSLSHSGNWTVEEDNGVCTPVASTSVLITVDELPVVDAGADSEINLGQNLTLNGASSIGTINWSPSNNLSSPNILNPIFTPSNGGTEYLTLAATNGTCSSDDVVAITIIEPILIPNAFTPNNDGENDVWMISGLDSYPDATLEIFNRWGSPVYKSIGSYKPWDGKRNGNIMPTHTYYFILKTSPEAEAITGSVTLVR